MVSKKAKPLWQCPKCTRLFANRNQWHSCVKISESEFLKGKDPEGVRLYRIFRDFVRRCGPIRIHPVRSRIAFMVRMRFAGVSRIGKGYIQAGFITHRRIASPRLTAYEFIAPNYHLHKMRIASEHELDEELFQWIREAYTLGTQEEILNRRKLLGVL